MPKVIQATEVSSTRRGRKPNLNPAIVSALSAMKPGEAVVFDKSDGFAKTTADDTKQRQQIRGSLTTHWSHSGQAGDCSVIFSEDGWPQVLHRAPKEDGTEG